MSQRRVSDVQAGRTRDLRPVRGASGDGLAGVAAVLPVVRAGLAQIIKQRPDPEVPGHEFGDRAVAVVGHRPALRALPRAVGVPRDDLVLGLLRAGRAEGLREAVGVEHVVPGPDGWVDHVGAALGVAR